MTMLDTADRLDPVKRDEPLTEPELIDCPFIHGGAVDFTDGVLTFVGWLKIVDPNGYEERRVKVRLAMPGPAAMKLYEQLGAVLSERWRARS